MYFDMPRNYAVDAKMKKKLKLELEQRVTVLLLITDDDHNYQLILFSIANAIPTNEACPNLRYCAYTKQMNG